MFSKTLLLSASALVSVVAASAANATDIYGGGASLPAPYVRQSADCWGNKTDLLIKGAEAKTINDFSYPSFECATAQVSAADKINYVSTGSGTGLAAFFSHEPTKYGTHKVKDANGVVQDVPSATPRSTLACLKPRSMKPPSRFTTMAGPTRA